MRHVSQLLDQDGVPQVQPDQPGGPEARREWYLSGRQGLREGMRLLETVKQEFLSLGRLDEKWNALLDEAFGPQFRQLLTQWMPSNKEAVLLAHALIEHAETYNLPLPSLKKEQDSTKDGGSKPVVIVDPEQGTQMVIKLLDLERSMLSDLWKSLEERASIAARAQNDAADYAPRYFSPACRDLDRAIDRFMYLKKNNF